MADLKMNLSQLETKRDELIKEIGWKEGDVLLWIDNQDGSWSLKKSDTH